MGHPPKRSSHATSSSGAHIYILSRESISHLGHRVVGRLVTSWATIKKIQLTCYRTQRRLENPLARLAEKLKAADLRRSFRSLEPSEPGLPGKSARGGHPQEDFNHRILLQGNAQTAGKAAAADVLGKDKSFKRFAFGIRSAQLQADPQADARFRAAIFAPAAYHRGQALLQKIKVDGLFEIAADAHRIA